MFNDFGYSFIRKLKFLIIPLWVWREDSVITMLAALAEDSTVIIPYQVAHHHL